MFSLLFTYLYIYHPRVWLISAVSGGEWPGRDFIFTLATINQTVSPIKKYMFLCVFYECVWGGQFLGPGKTWLNWDDMKMTQKLIWNVITPEAITVGQWHISHHLRHEKKKKKNIGKTLKYTASFSKGNIVHVICSLNPVTWMFQHGDSGGSFCLPCPLSFN